MQKNILITGGAGFVGSSLALSIKSKYPNYEVTCLDNLKRRGSELNVPRLRERGINFVHGDIRKRQDIESVGRGITTIIDASAEPSVVAGINGSPEYVIDTNLLGTINCLYLASRLKADFVFLSTSRVYPIEGLDGISFSEEEKRFTVSKAQTIKGISVNGVAEDFPLEGVRSLYGATKLSSELLIREFSHFYDFNAVVNRCGVLAGAWQMGKVDQGVAVLWVARHFWKQPLSYIGYGGKGKQVRDILHVDDLFRLVDYEMHHMDKVANQTLNVGGGAANAISLMELTELCRKVTGNTINIESVIENRQADIRIYITDNARVKNLTGWKPEIPVQQTIQEIFEWIAGNEGALKPILGT